MCMPSSQGKTKICIKLFSREIDKLRYGRRETQNREYQNLFDIVQTYNTSLDTVDYLRSVGYCLHEYSQS